jgi:hypothetical protein
MMNPAVIAVDPLPVAASTLIVSVIGSYADPRICAATAAVDSNETGAATADAIAQRGTADPTTPGLAGVRTRSGSAGCSDLFDRRPDV